MTSQYSGREVVEIGIIIEQNGRDFYTELASTSENNAAKTAFAYLANEEAKHINYFQKILDKVQEMEEVEGVNEEFYSHINQLAEQHVFTKQYKGKEVAQNIQSATEAIDMAMRFEKESIALFEAMRKVVSPENVVVVNTLVEEEEAHLKKLIDLKSTVK